MDKAELFDSKVKVQVKNYQKKDRWKQIYTKLILMVVSLVVSPSNQVIIGSILVAACGLKFERC